MGQACLANGAGSGRPHAGLETAGETHAVADLPLGQSAAGLLMGFPSLEV